MREVKKVCVVTIEVMESGGYLACIDTLLHMSTFTEKTMNDLINRLPDGISKALAGTSEALGKTVEAPENAD